MEAETTQQQQAETKDFHFGSICSPKAAMLCYTSSDLYDLMLHPSYNRSLKVWWNRTEFK